MNRKVFFVLLALAGVVYILNLLVDVMEVDAAQYAEMSWEMLTTKNYLQLFCLGHDYLDKPPLLFWLNTFSFSVLGISNISYKLPSLLFALLGIYSTYRFALLYYSRSIAYTAAIMLATTQAVFLITNDVRTDTLLMGAVIFAIWQLATYFNNLSIVNLCLGGLGIALAMLAKGPIGLIAVGAAFFPYIVVAQKWRAVFSWKLLLPLAIVAILLLPMSLGLYQQWGIKGLRFYYWTQSFGRITGESEWNNLPDTFFLVHTTAWAFMPWSLFLFGGLITGFAHLFKTKLKPGNMASVITLSGFTLVLIALMLSKYQLPHYIFVVYPLGAVIAAVFLQQVQQVKPLRNWLMPVQLLALFGFIALSVLLQVFLKGSQALSLISLIIIYPLLVIGLFKLNHRLTVTETVALTIYQQLNRFFRIGISFKKAYSLLMDIAARNVVAISAAVIIAFNILMSAFYFPEILTYQGENDLGKYIQHHIAPGNNFIAFQFIPNFATVFYARHMPAATLWEAEEFNKVLNEKDTLLAITSTAGIEKLNTAGIKYTVLEERYTYKVSRLTGTFLNPKTRLSVCDKIYLVQAYR